MSCPIGSAFRLTPSPADQISQELTFALGQPRDFFPGLGAAACKPGSVIAGVEPRTR